MWVRAHIDRDTRDTSALGNNVLERFHQCGYIRFNKFTWDKSSANVILGDIVDGYDSTVDIQVGGEVFDEEIWS